MARLLSAIRRSEIRGLDPLIGNCWKCLPKRQRLYPLACTSHHPDGRNTSRCLTIRSRRTATPPLNSSVRPQLKEFTRQPTQRERALALVLNAGLCILFGWLVTFLAFRGIWVASSIFVVLLIVTLVLLVRAALGARQALNRKQVHVLAWALMVLGAGGVAIALLLSGSVAQRLMAVAGSITLFSTGLAGVRGRGHDA